jgi:hypothetical protein
MHNTRVAFILAAIAGAATGFAIHLGTQAWIREWVAAHMAGRSVAPSWDVRLLAAATSLELGVATVFVYVLLRKSLPGLPTIFRGALLAALLLAVTGRLVRQPVMDLAIGNPVSVVLIQDGVAWLTWAALCIAVASVYDRLAAGAIRD